jgi:hypothetical protein
MTTLTNASTSGFSTGGTSVVVGGTIVEYTDAFTPTAGQTVFTLSNVPVTPTNTVMTINGKAETSIGANPGFTIVGETVTWLNSYTLGTDDRVFITYT